MGRIFLSPKNKLGRPSTPFYIFVAKALVAVTVFLVFVYFKEFKNSSNNKHVFIPDAAQTTTIHASTAVTSAHTLDVATTTSKSKNIYFGSGKQQRAFISVPATMLKQNGMSAPQNATNMTPFTITKRAGTYPYLRGSASRAIYFTFFVITIIPF